MPVENFLYGFKAAPRGRSRRRHGRPSRNSVDTPAGLASGACRLARKAKARGRLDERRHRATFLRLELTAPPH